MAIRSKILIAMVLSVAVFFTCVIGVAYREMNIVFVDNFKTNSNAQLDRMNTFIQNFFNNASSVAEFLADNTQTIGIIEGISSYADSKEDIKPIGENLPFVERNLFHTLLLITKKFPAIVLAYINNNSGGITQAPNDLLPAGFNPAKRPWYIDTIKANKTIVTEIYISTSGDAVATVATPIRKDGKVVGVSALDITLQTLSNETGSVKVGKTGHVLLFDGLKQVVSDPVNSGPNIPENERWLGKTISDLPGDASRVMNDLYTLGDGFKEVYLNGKTWLASVQTTPRGWVLVMLQERDEVFEGAVTVTQHIAFAGAIVAIVLVLAAIAIANSIARPIVALSSAAHSVAEGDLSAIPENESLYTGELRVLHISLKRMVVKLVELIETANVKIKEAENSLEVSRNALEDADQARRQGEISRREGILETADRIGDIVSDLTGAVEKLSNEAQQTNEYAEEQKNRVEGTTTAITQMNAAVSEVAQTTSRTALLAEDARIETQKGKTLVFDLVNSMSTIEKKALAMQSSLGNLQTQANAIGNIMSIINDIADQTNLLALNAAIEAARAGDAGRGFAVVADEVRKLAEKTVEATKQVDTSISSIQRGSEENMKAIEDTVAFVSESTDVANTAGVALAEIEEMVKNTASEVRSIATASEEQSSTLESINVSTEEIYHITLDVTQSAVSSSDAIHQVAGLSRNLQKIVSDLQKANG